jgi:DNA-binding MarR family transcriptional regulator
MSTTRWLDESEQALWRAYLETTQLLWDRLARELDDDSELPLPEYEILVRLSEAPGRALRMSDIADALVHSRSRLTHTVTRMERRGFVTRRPCPDDGRGVLCVITDGGYAALAAAAPVHVEGVRSHLFDQLDDDEVAVLGRVLAKMRDHLREARTTTPGYRG